MTPDEKLKVTTTTALKLAIIQILPLGVAGGVDKSEWPQLLRDLADMYDNELQLSTNDI